MKVYSPIIISICCICKYTSVYVMPELKRNILNFGYGINFKYEATFPCSFDRFYVVPKFILPAFEDIIFLPIIFYLHCYYLNVDLDKNRYAVQHLLYIKNFCVKIVSFIYYY